MIFCCSGSDGSKSDGDRCTSNLSPCISYVLVGPFGHMETNNILLNIYLLEKHYNNNIDLPLPQHTFFIFLISKYFVYILRKIAQSFNWRTFLPHVVTADLSHSIKQVLCSCMLTRSQVHTLTLSFSSYCFFTVHILMFSTSIPSLLIKVFF